MSETRKEQVAGQDGAVTEESSRSQALKDRLRPCPEIRVKLGERGRRLLTDFSL